jgi:hypothetical protein
MAVGGERGEGRGERSQRRIASSLAPLFEEHSMPESKCSIVERMANTGWPNWQIVFAKGCEMAVKDYRELIVWQKAMDLVETIYRITSTFPREEIYWLVRSDGRLFPSLRILLKETVETPLVTTCIFLVWLMVP